MDIPIGFVYFRLNMEILFHFKYHILKSIWTEYSRTDITQVNIMLRSNAFENRVRRESTQHVLYEYNNYCMISNQPIYSV